MVKLCKCLNIRYMANVAQGLQYIVELIKSIINIDTLYHFGGIGENSIESGKDYSGSKERYNYIRL